MTPPRPPPSPAARRIRRLEKGVVRALHGFVNGIEWWQRDPHDVVDRTPFDIVHSNGKLQVRRYRPLVADDAWELGTEVFEVRALRRATPVLLVPPLMVQPFIFDLTSRRSLVRVLLKQGFDVFLVDFGQPDRADERINLDRYVLDWMPQAVEVVLNTARAAGVSLLGYCQGGLFALMYTSAHDDLRVRAIVTIGSPVDAHKMGLLTWIVRMGHKEIEFLSKKLGNVPGPVSSTAFKLTNPWRSVTRYSDLFMNLWNDEYVAGFDAVSAWTDHFVDYPGDAFRQLMRDFMLDNKLKDGRMEFQGKVADLRKIACPVLAFGGKSDRIVPVAAARELVAVVGSADKQFVEVPGGHMGVFAGREAPAKVWEVAARWLGERT
jgi:polyhydroxyalkanoate synthase